MLLLLIEQGWEIKTSGTDPQVLRLRITDVPGWHATIDGKPLKLEPFAGVMLQVRALAGDHTVVLHYWPSSLTIGIFLAVLSAAGLITAGVVGRARRRRRSIDFPVEFGRRSKCTRRRPRSHKQAVAR